MLMNASKAGIFLTDSPDSPDSLGRWGYISGFSTLQPPRPRALYTVYRALRCGVDVVAGI